MESILSSLANLTRIELEKILDNVVGLLGPEGLDIYEQKKRFSVGNASSDNANTPSCPQSNCPSERVVDNKTNIKKKSKAKSFDMSKFRQRHIALQVEYDGTAYSGFASQDQGDTVENHLFNALERLNLIDSKKTCNYSRCGRTDKGVSALRQVVALNLRSALSLAIPDDQLPTKPEGTVAFNGKVCKEMDYCTMLNNQLPVDIRVLAFCPVTPQFSARFSCTYRQYRYFFIKSTLDIQAMQTACGYLVGEHDFRNFCKLDIENVTNFKREVFSASILPFWGMGGVEEVYMLEIKGIAFLWHMVRCIMSVLFMVGRGEEKAEIVLSLLDTALLPSKPSYPLAPDNALVLHDCGYEKLSFAPSLRSLWQLTGVFKSRYEDAMIAAMRARNALEHINAFMIEERGVLEYMEEIIEQKERAMKRVQERGVKIRPGKEGNKKVEIEGGEQGTSKGGVKRKRENSSEEEEERDERVEEETGEKKQMTWREALMLISLHTQHSPSLSPVPNFHLPLLLRPREETYEEKVGKLTGSRKERLERHLALSEAAKDTTPLFFQRMREEGAIDKEKEERGEM